MNKLKISWAKFMVIRFYYWQGCVLRFFSLLKLYRTWCREYKVEYYKMVQRRFNELVDKEGGENK